MVMPVYGKSLMRLTTYLAQSASVENPIDVATLAQHTGISGSNIRLLFSQNPDIFHSTKIGNTSCYFLVPNDKARRILVAASRAGGNFTEFAINVENMQTAIDTVTAMETRPISPTKPGLVLDKTEPNDSIAPVAEKKWMFLNEQDIMNAEKQIVDESSLEAYWDDIKRANIKDIQTPKFLRSIEAMMYVITKE